MERVDGAQARLKQKLNPLEGDEHPGGKGGWGSGEIETRHAQLSSQAFPYVERVDGAQARLKQLTAHILTSKAFMWKGWMGLRRD